MFDDPSSFFPPLLSPDHLSKSLTASIRQKARAKMSQDLSPFLWLLGISVTGLQQLPGKGLLGEMVTQIL